MRKSKRLVSYVLVFVLLVIAAEPALAAVTHKVKAGDTLFKLSQWYGSTINGIKNANGLKSNTIYIGQYLTIPTTAAVKASRSGSGYSQDDVYWLARAVYGEARGEIYTGQVAVAAVILNRVESPLFPNTVKEVIFEHLAFTAVADGQIYLTPNGTAIKAARDAIAGWDPSGGALYYWNSAKATSKWVWSRPIIKTIGNHVFAR